MAKKQAKTHDAAAHGAAAPAVVSVPIEFRVVRWFIWVCTVSAETLGCPGLLSPCTTHDCLAPPLMIFLVLCRPLGWPGYRYACIDEQTVDRHWSNLRVE
jgi:hypothetical protein